jgi:hypothetical protein
MRTGDVPPARPRSAAGLALAIALAVASVSLSGVVIELSPYLPSDARAQVVSAATGRCANESTHGEPPCPSARSRDDRR